MSKQVDVVVIGAGHNGLIAAAYLAKAGLRVVVLEARGVIGGGTTTEELTIPGFKHDPFASGHAGLLGNPMFSRDELPLSKYGLAYVAPDPMVTLPTAKGSISLWHDESRTAAEFRKYSDEDAAAWRQLCRDWSLLAPIALKTLSTAPSSPRSKSMRPIARLAEFLGLSRRVLARMSPAQALKMKELAGATALDVIDRRFKSPEVRELMTWLVAITGQPIDQKGTGPLALALPTSFSRNSWINAIGGSIALPKALAGYIADLGGEVIENAKVERILMDKDRACGVRTSDGREFRADKAVLSSVHFTLIPKLMPDATLPKGFLAGVKRWEDGPAWFLVHLALDHNPPVRSGDRSMPSVLTGSGSPEGLRKQYADMRAGKASTHDDLWMLASCITFADPSRAPKGKGVVRITTIVPYALRGDPKNWESYKDEYADILLKLYARCVEDYAPGQELARKVVSPVDLQSVNPNFFHGSAQGGHSLPSQAGQNRPVAGWAAYRGPVPHLYLTGLSTHPGGAVNGWSGRNAARAILEDFKLDADRFVPPV